MKGKRRIRVLCLGLDVCSRAVLTDALGSHTVVFGDSELHAEHEAKRVDVIAVCVDKHPQFLDGVIKDGYAGKVVVVATSSKTINKPFKLPSGEGIDPVCWRKAPEMILEMFSSASTAQA